MVQQPLGGTKHPENEGGGLHLHYSRIGPRGLSRDGFHWVGRLKNPLLSDVLWLAAFLAVPQETVAESK